MDHLVGKFSGLEATLSSAYEEKLREMRKAEGLTQAAFAELTGIDIGTIKNYESGKRGVGLAVIERVLKIDAFKKYTMWLMTDETNEAAGQISPALSLDGSGSTSSHRSGKKVG